MDSRVIRQNPWWSSGTRAMARDPHLTKVEEAPIAWRPVEIPFDFDTDLVYTIRGPRQVGKTTLLKHLIRERLFAERDPRGVLYLDVERAGALSYRDLMDMIEDYLRWSEEMGVGGQRCLFMDEVTGVDKWSTALRALDDAGELTRVTVLATGSNAKDVRTGGDRLPGRRGERASLDYLLYPLSFRDYLSVLDAELVNDVPSLAQDELLDPGAVHALADRVMPVAPEIQRHFVRYLATGGYLLALANHLDEGGVEAYVYSLYRDAILGEVARMGRREEVLRPVIIWLHGRLGEEFQWRKLARETGAANHETLRDTVEDLENAYLWHVFKRVKNPSGCEPAQKSPKKLYPLDPFTWHMLSAWGRGITGGWRHTQAGLSDPSNVGTLVESVVADHLRRLFGSYAFYYRTRGGQEIDFTACSEGRARGLIEVKYRRTIQRKHRSALRDRGGGLLLTRDSHTWHPEDRVREVPVSVMLALWPADTLFETGF